MLSLIKTLILILFFIIPLFHSKIFQTFWIESSFLFVNWNFEFSKVMFFNIFSGIIILLYTTIVLSKNPPAFGIPLNKGDKNISLIGFTFYLLLIISTIFSVSPYTSFFWDSAKWHSFVMFSNLVWIYFILRQILDEAFFQKIIKTLIISWSFVSIIWFWQYFFPSFEYGELQNRLFSTFGHPNYLSVFLFALFPFLIKDLTFTKEMFQRNISTNNFCKNISLKYLLKLALLFLFLTTLFFTKSFIAIILLFIYLFFVLFIYPQGAPRSSKERVDWAMTFFYKGIIFLLFIILIIIFFFPEKLTSFVSRFFIWQTSLEITFSSFRNFFFWSWISTLDFYFDNYKSIYLYIFENFGFTADRPHNIILEFLYFFWILWLIFISYIYFYTIKKIKHTNLLISQDSINVVSTHSLLLILIFLLFNFASITIYLIIVLFLAYLNKNTNVFPILLWCQRRIIGGFRIFETLFLFLIFLISLIWIFYSAKFYLAESYIYRNNFYKAKEIFPYNYNYYFLNWDFKAWLELVNSKPQSYFLAKIIYEEDKKTFCNEFLKKFTSAENYFFCWNIFYNQKDFKIAKKYYETWLSKLPNLWDKDSIYYESFLVKLLKINWNRFMSEKFQVKEVLEKIK